MLSIDTELCTGCKRCLEVCPDYVFSIDSSNNNRIIIRYPEHCCSCGHCVSICPESAVLHEKLPENTFSEIQGGQVDEEDLKNLITGRRSIRKYKRKHVPEDLIQQLVDCGIHAGTGGNVQSEDFIIVQNQTFLRKLETIVIDSLWNGGIKFFTGKGVINKILQIKFGLVLSYQYGKYNKIIKRRRENNDLDGMVFRGAPVVIIVHGLKENTLAQTNAALALRNIELMAQTMGLGTCYSGFLVSASEMKQKKINRCIGLDNSRQVAGALMMGYPKYKYSQRLPRNERDVRWI